MIGASMVAGFDLLSDSDLIVRMSTPLLLGFFSALITGYVVITWFMKLLKEKKLTWFAYYCFGLGLIGTVYFSSQSV
jgi:undecaprenyl pyrophosphate phosphatase UppP